MKAARQVEQGAAWPHFNCIKEGERRDVEMERERDGEERRERERERTGTKANL